MLRTPATPNQKEGLAPKWPVLMLNDLVKALHCLLWFWRSQQCWTRFRSAIVSFLRHLEGHEDVGLMGMILRYFGTALWCATS